MRSKSNFLILVVAIVMGAIAAFLARSFIQGQSQVATSTARTIVVAASPIEVGVVILDDHLAEITWNSATLPEGAFGSKQEFLKGGRRFSLVPIARNEPVLNSKVAESGHGGLLSALLDKDMRAVTVRVDDVSGVAGFILPGSRVDVAMIRTESSGGAAPSTSSNIIIQNIKVLATDQVTGVTVEKAALVARAVTLEVSSEDAQKVLIAEKVGKLSLILRQNGGVNTEARRITERDLSNFPLEPAKAEAREVVAPVMPQKNTNTTVIIVRGAKPEEYSVKNGN